MNNKKERSTAPNYFWGDNCQSWILADTEELLVKEESMPAFTKEKLHLHQHAQQFFFILKGTANFYMDDEKYLLNHQEGLLVPAGAAHYIANESSETLDFLVISHHQ